jgi:pyruvate dehydrogenase E2 component (dihydrolipoamide acetyltransferase)
MPINILMPALSPTMEKGNLARWLKKEGDRVAPGDVIAEIETDKATMEVEAVDEGTLAKIVVPEGTVDVPVNQVIAVLAGEGEDVQAAAAAAGKATTTPMKKPSSTEAALEPVPATPPRPSSPGPEAGPKLREPVVHPAVRSQELPSTNGRAAPRIFSSPLARRLAREAGIDLSRLTGTGPHGRIIARDVVAAKEGRGVVAPAPTAPAAPPPIQAPADEQIRALYEPGTYEVVPHDNMRRIIARRLVEAKLTIPHFYLTVDCTIDRLLAAREEINAAAPKDKDGKPAYKLSVNDFVIKALALALQKVPNANVTWTESGMLKHKHSDVGVAVAIPGGLITPVVRRAEQKSLSVISNEMRDLAARARARRLKPEEYQGGSTAVSNLGMYGIRDFAAVINPPHATLLAVGAGEERAVVRNGRIEIATVMTVTLSCDHRAVDGALGAELLGAFKTLIENPVLMVV